jgi:hypothetical protein
MRWQKRGRGNVSKENEVIQIHAKYETGPTHAQLVRMTWRRGYTTVSSPPALVWTSWSPTDSSSKGALSRGIVFGPRSSFQIRNVGWYAGGFETMAHCCQIVFGEMDLSLYDGELVTEMSESVVLSTVALQFSGGVSVVEVGDGTTKGVEGWGQPDEEGLEPAGECLGDVRG